MVFYKLLSTLFNLKATAYIYFKQTFNSESIFLGLNRKHRTSITFLLLVVSSLSLQGMKYGELPEQPFKTFSNLKGDTFVAKVNKYIPGKNSFVLEKENGTKLYINKRSLKYFCNDDRSYLNWLYHRTKLFGAKRKGDIPATIIDPFLEDDKFDSNKEYAGYLKFHTKGRWDSANKTNIFRKGTRLENCCPCYSHPKLMKLTDEDEYKCVMNERINGWLKAMPHPPEYYTSILVMRKHTGGMVPCSFTTFNGWIGKTLPFSYTDKMPFTYSRDESLFHSIVIRLEEHETIKDLSALTNFPNLIYVNIENSHVEDLAPLKELKYLSYLSLTNNKIKKFDDLVDNEYLGFIDLEFNDIRYFDPIKDFVEDKALTHLILSHNPLTSDDSAFKFPLKRKWNDRFCRIPICGPNRGKKIHSWTNGFAVLLSRTPHDPFTETIQENSFIKSSNYARSFMYPNYDSNIAIANLRY